MADYVTNRRNSNTQLLQELEALSETLYQPPSHTTTTRRTASLVLPRDSIPSIESLTGGAKNDNDTDSIVVNPKPRARRMSLSPWRSRPKQDIQSEDNIQQQSNTSTNTSTSNTKLVKKLDSKGADSNSQKKGLWNWKPIRALAHIGKQKLSCLFSVEVVTVQGLPASMNGLRLSVCVRKKETKDGAVQTMPSRVSQGAADFEETLFIRCHVYYTPGTGTSNGGARYKFEPRPFSIFVFAVDAEELDFGKNMVDLSEMIEESVQKSFEGNRIRQWDTSYTLSGKAKGGEVVLKLGFQIMEKDGGVGIYSQAEGGTKNAKSYSSSFARKQSKTSFSVQSPRMSSLSSANWTPSQAGTTANIQGIDELNLDDEPVKEEPESKAEDLDLPDFDIVDKGIEIQDKGVEMEDKDEATKEVGEEEEDGDERSEGNSDKRSVSSSHEVVKEVVHDQMHLTRLSALDSIAQQIKALESMFKDENQVKMEEDDSESQRLDANEETVTREFLQMLEDPGVSQLKTDNQETPALKLQGGGGGNEDNEKRESGIFIPDLAKGLGCVVQTRNGGFLAAMNPLNTAVLRKDAPKLAMQISKPFVLPSIPSSMNGFELFQRMAAAGLEEFTSKILSMMPMEELMGKTAEQIAFEGIASAIIQGRNKEGGASSSAAETVAVVKSMATAMNTSRNERISTGIWNISDKPLTVDEILAFTLQKMEAMTIEALKIQADIPEEEAPFDVQAIKKDDDGHPLDSAVPLEDWTKYDKSDSIMISVVVQLRDPLRQFEAVGGPMIALVQAVPIDEETNNFDDEEKKFKIACLAIGGLKVRSGGRKNTWDTEKQKLTAMQWLVAYGLGKMGKKAKKSSPLKGQDLLWSISSRVMADMWLKSIRNPDIKFIM
ncbi:uncharacterized protein [Solanum tuberosum]|uniref:C2 NT-type domain-containing protein n=1 Tax=Solanum tuberosum TaxID=4113 RepID=M1B550_SOLTU|nr:PREDICTED: uncharacterized protein LOC102591140 [Solanum tuberosum]